MITEARTIATGWQVKDPTGDDLCPGGGQLLTPFAYTDGREMRPLEAVRPREWCPMCGRLIAVALDYDGPSIVPHRTRDGALIVQSEQIGLGL